MKSLKNERQKKLNNYLVGKRARVEKFLKKSFCQSESAVLGTTIEGQLIPSRVFSNNLTAKNVLQIGEF